MANNLLITKNNPSAKALRVFFDLQEAGAMRQLGSASGVVFQKSLLSALAKVAGLFLRNVQCLLRSALSIEF